jgi:hypothetical protein
MTMLVIGERERESLGALRMRAAAAIVEMQGLPARLATPEGKRAHQEQMNAQSAVLPVGYIVTFSIERGHPCGVCRHLSMSTSAPDRVPRPEALWMVAEILGFCGGLEACVVWDEELQRGPARAIAINVVQPIAVAAARHA